MDAYEDLQHPVNDACDSWSVELPYCAWNPLNKVKRKWLLGFIILSFYVRYIEFTRSMQGTLCPKVGLKHSIMFIGNTISTLRCSQR